MITVGLALSATAQVSVEQEVALGRQAAQKLEAQIGVDPNPELNQRLQRIAQQLIPVCGRNNIQYSFKVLNSDQFNAMAIPGGYVYATRKLMQQLPDGELAFVLGHELSHVVKRHSIRQMENDQQRRLGLMAILIGLGGGRVNRDAAALAGVADQIMSNRFSQADEEEADREGAAILSRAGIDPCHTLSALHILAAQHESDVPGVVNALLGSHPLPKERIQAAYRYLPFLPFSGAPAPAPVSLPAWDEQQFLRTLQAATGMSVDPQLAQEASQNGTALSWTCPAGETYGVMEQRVLTTPKLRQSILAGRRFGIHTVTDSQGRRVYRLKVR